MHSLSTQCLQPPNTHGLETKGRIIAASDITIFSFVHTQVLAKSCLYFQRLAHPRPIKYVLDRHLLLITMSVACSSLDSARPNHTWPDASDFSSGTLRSSGCSPRYSWQFLQDGGGEANSTRPSIIWEQGLHSRCTSRSR